VRIALDTNVLVYAEGVSTEERQTAARALIAALAEHELVLPVQAAGELFNVLVRKDGRTPAEARAMVRAWTDALEVVGTGSKTFEAATDLADRRRLQIWDAVILAAAVEATCDLLLSEDLQDGFVWRGVTVANPFKAELHPLLADLLEARG